MKNCIDATSQTTFAANFLYIESIFFGRQLGYEIYRWMQCFFHRSTLWMVWMICPWTHQMSSIRIGSHDVPEAQRTRLKQFKILSEGTLFTHGPWESGEEDEWPRWKNPVHSICPRGMWGPPWERAHGGSLAYTRRTWKEWSMHALELRRHM